MKIDPMKDIVLDYRISKVLFSRILEIRYLKNVWVFGIVRHDKMWCWYRKTYYGEGSCGSKQIITSVNPLPRWWHRFKMGCLRGYLKFSGKAYKICECCGDGLATWKIDELNREKKKLTACDYCVSFYDLDYTRKPIKRWENGKAYIR